MQFAKSKAIPQEKNKMCCARTDLTDSPSSCLSTRNRVQENILSTYQYPHLRCVIYFSPSASLSLISH